MLDYISNGPPTVPVPSQNQGSALAINASNGQLNYSNPSRGQWTAVTPNVGALMNVYYDGVKYKRFQFDSALENQDVAVYTCPANTRAEFTGLWFIQNSGSNLAVLTKLKKANGGPTISFSSITAGGVAGNQGTPLGLTSSSSTIAIYLEPGDQILVNPATGTGAWTAKGFVGEFSPNIRIKTIAFSSLTTGDNLIYTCPSGFMAVPPCGRPSASGFGFAFQTNQALYLINNTGGARTITIHAVPNGGTTSSVSTLYMTQESVNNGFGFSPNNTQAPINQVLLAKESLVINVDTGGTFQGLFTVMELPN